MTVDGLERFPSARDIEKVARNPECLTLRTALAGNLDLRKYAETIGLAKDQKQSPLAIARGNQVERQILGKDAARLVDRFVQDGMIAEGPTVEDLGRRRAHNRAGMQKASKQTDAYISALMASDPVPDILIHPVLSVPLGPNLQFIEPDALVRYTGRSMYEPLELKSYPYREGRTDPEDLRQARRQGAVYVYALRGRVEDLGGSVNLVLLQATLVFTEPGSLFPHPVYGEAVLGEMRDVELAIRLLDEARTALPELLAEHESLVELLPALDFHYTERCLTFCPLAKSCRGRVREQDHVVVLGEQSGRLLAPASQVARVMELLEGGAPGSEAEQAMTERLVQIATQVGQFEEAV